jgi:hypothetical protein
MAKYLFTWHEVDTLNLIIDADSKREALDKFFANDYDNEEVENVNVMFDEDSLEVEAV